MRVYVWLLLPCLIACEESVSLDWKFPLKAGSVSTPLVTDSYIAVGSDKGLVIAEKDGTLRCRFEQAGQVVSAPATDGKLIFFGSTNYLAYALDPQCKPVWSVTTGDRIKSDPLVDNGRVYFTSYDGYIYALDAKTGKQIWLFPKKTSPEVVPGQFELEQEEPAVSETQGPTEEEPIKPTSSGESDADGDSSGADSVKEISEQPTVGGFSYSSPAIFENVLYVGNLDHRLYAIDIETGLMRWRFKTDAPVTSSPKVAGGTLYFGSNDGNVYAINPRQITVKWKSKTQHWVNSSPLVANKRLYIGSNDKHLYAFNVRTGHAVWKFSTIGDVISIPAAYKNLIFIAGGTGDGRIYALENRNGRSFWSYKTGGKIESDPIVDNDKLYVSSTDGYLYAFTIRKTQAQ